MKNHAIITLWIFIALTTSCKEDTNDVAMDATLSNDCIYNQRKAVDKFDNEEGTIVLVKEQNVYEISSDKMSKEYNNRLLSPCNLPEEFKKNNLKIIYSGELKEEYAWEDRTGQPFKLTKLSSTNKY